MPQVENTDPVVLVTAAHIHPDAVKVLEGFRLVYASVHATEEELAELCRDLRPRAILVRYGQISANVIAAAMPSLKVIAKHGVGTDNIDSAAARANSVSVCAALGSNSQAVAEITMAFLLASARKIITLDSRMRAGHWDRDDYRGIELSGATLGLVGAGAIGRRVAVLARAFGMQVNFFDPRAKATDLPDGTGIVDKETLFATSDAISLHCPLTPETRGMIGAQALATMKKGAILINTARAQLIDETALLEALRADRLMAAIDCYPEEPLAEDSPLRSAPNIILTPHIAGTTEAAFRAMGVGAAQHIRQAFSAIGLLPVPLTPT